MTVIVGPDGEPVMQYTYDEFGRLSATGEASFDNEITYTGSITDTSTGLQYMNARFYEPSTGRFISQDSYSGNAYEPWTQHLYSYCGNNPTNFVDPTGHSSVLVPVMTGPIGGPASGSGSSTSGSEDDEGDDSSVGGSTTGSGDDEDEKVILIGGGFIWHHAFGPYWYGQDFFNPNSGGPHIHVRHGTGNNQYNPEYHDGTPAHDSNNKKFNQGKIPNSAKKWLKANGKWPDPPKSVIVPEPEVVPVGVPEQGGITFWEGALAAGIIIGSGLLAGVIIADDYANIQADNVYLPQIEIWIENSWAVLFG